jgi:hypothetical protein
MTTRDSNGLPIGVSFDLRFIEEIGPPQTRKKFKWTNTIKPTKRRTRHKIPSTTRSDELVSTPRRFMVLIDSTVGVLVALSRAIAKLGASEGGAL